MELVIKIDEVQKQMVDALMEIPPQVENDLISAIRHGTPLLKGHGRLIDENDLWFEDIDDISCVTQRNVENAPTIIEADTES